MNKYMNKSKTVKSNIFKLDKTPSRFYKFDKNQRNLSQSANPLDSLRKHLNHILKYIIKHSCSCCSNKDRCETYIKYYKEKDNSR